MILCLGFSDVMGIDISEAIETKLRKAAEKYPVMKSARKRRLDGYNEFATS